MPQIAGLPQVVVSSLTTGALYALLVFGMLIVYRVSKSVNFSHGALGMVAAFVAFVAYSAGLPIWAGICIGMAAAALISFATDRFILEPISRKGAREGLDIVVTLGVFLLVTAAAESIFGTSIHPFAPLGTEIPVKVGSVYLNLNQVVITIAVLLMLAGFAWFLSKTSFGLAMRAVATDASLASSMGLNVRRVRAITWAFAGLTVGAVGIVVASRLSLDPYYMTPFLIKAVIAGIIGGLDRFMAPLLAAFGLAVFEGLATYFIGTNYATPAVFVLVIGLLAFLPKRLLSERGVVRA
jgi:branched-chain amino acid transport system permease protein